MAKKSIDWADITGPARDFEAAVTNTRTVKDLPTVAVGAKEIAFLSIFREEQKFAFKPIMSALQFLQQQTDWSHQYLVADRTSSEFFDWRQMPLRQYQSFADFYRRELEPVWGDWEVLQTTWKEIVAGTISEDEGRRIILRGHGGDRKSEGFKDQGGNTRDVTTLNPNEKNTKAHILARLNQNRPDLAARVRAKTMSANAAAIEAGFRKKRERKRIPAVNKIKKLIQKLSLELSAEDIAGLIKELRAIQ